MRIVCDIKGYYEWLPVPEGTPITEEDVKRLRVKPMTDGKYHMKVPMKVTDVPPDLRHFDCGISESHITEHMAILASLDKTVSREEWVGDHFKVVMEHHVHRQHLIEIHVQDDGPDAEAFEAQLEKMDVDGERAELALASYTEETDLEEYLNMRFKTDAYRKSKGGLQ